MRTGNFSDPIFLTIVLLPGESILSARASVQTRGDNGGRMLKLPAFRWTSLLSWNGFFHFSEPLQTNSSSRFYRISAP
jgi:hypothetical protein